jgi:hypothetical protein
VQTQKRIQTSVHDNRCIILTDEEIFHRGHEIHLLAGNPVPNVAQQLDEFCLEHTIEVLHETLCLRVSRTTMGEIQITQPSHHLLHASVNELSSIVAMHTLRDTSIFEQGKY